MIVKVCLTVDEDTFILLTVRRVARVESRKIPNQKNLTVTQSNLHLIQLPEIINSLRDLIVILRVKGFNWFVVR